MLDECTTNKLFFLGEQSFKQLNFSFPVYIIVFVNLNIMRLKVVFVYSKLNFICKKLNMC